MALDESNILRVLFQARARLSASVWLVVRDAQTAEDIFQNVAVRALNHELHFDHEAQLLSWVHVAARREALDWLRRHRHRWVALDEGVLEHLDAGWAPEAEKPAGPRLHALEECLRRVSETGRRLLRLRYFEGRSCAEVAQAMGLSIEAVYQRLTRLHRQLKTCIELRLSSPPTDSPAP